MNAIQTDAVVLFAAYWKKCMHHCTAHAVSFTVGEFVCSSFRDKNHLFADAVDFLLG